MKMRKPVSAFTKCFSQREILRVSFHCINGRMTKRQGKNSSEGPDVTHCLAWVRLGKSNGLWGLPGTLVPFWSRIQRGHGPGFLLIGIMWESLTRCWRSVCRRKVTRADPRGTHASWAPHSTGYYTRQVAVFVSLALPLWGKREQ